MSDCYLASVLARFLVSWCAGVQPFWCVLCWSFGVFDCGSFVDCCSVPCDLARCCSVDAVLLCAGNMRWCAGVPVCWNALAMM